MKDLLGFSNVLVISAALGLGSCASSDKDSGDEGTGEGSGGTCDGADCGEEEDEEPAPPRDLTPYFDEMEARCAGVFAGHGVEDGDPVVVPCRYDGVGYALEVHLEGEPACKIEGEDADCSNATLATVELLGELVAADDTYVVTGLAQVASDPVDVVGTGCDYRPEDRDPSQLPNLEEWGSETDLGITFIQWRHEDWDQGDYLDYEYCRFVLEEHTPPG